MDDEQFPSGCGGIRALSWVLCRVCFLVRAFLCAPGRWCAWIARCVLGKREKVRPARQKWLVFGVFGLAGRVFSRFGLDGGVVGRTFSRREATEVLLGELFRAGRPRRCCWANFFAPGGRGGVVGRTFSRREATGALLGELFRAATTPATPAISR